MNLIPREQWFDMDRIFDSFFTFRKHADENEFFKPRVDITDKEDHYEIVAELPGVKKEDINVQLSDGVLTIEAKMDEESSSEKGKVIRKERRTGFFSRSFTVGTNINADDISAHFENGLLSLSAPKFEPQIEDKRKITIN